MTTHIRQRGFTLLELVIAITLIGLIVLIVTGAMRLSYRSVSSGEKRIDQLERLRTTAGVIDAQVQSCMPLRTEPDTEPKSSLKGQSDSLELATNYSLWKGRAGYVLAAYHIALGEDGRQALSISEHTVGVDDTRETQLLGGFDEMRFSYYATAAGESEGSWAEEWTDETLMPEKVRLIMKRAGKSMVMTIPLRVRGAEDWTSFTAVSPGTEQQ
ncbi:MAG: prepilin-type N-terminal cleavage/methylation domain-containing protein [Nitrospirae bacterium]|nr:prepilin-type N-terminal cleavage/methylation domain-containing protein [Nitrospirota bacterium]